MKKRSSFLSCFSCFFPTAGELDTNSKGGKDKRGSSTGAGFYIHQNTLYENGALPNNKASKGSYIMMSSKTPSKLLPNIAENEASEDLFASQKPYPHADQAIATVLQPVSSASSSSPREEDEADVQDLYQEMNNLNDEKYIHQITIVEEMDKEQDSDDASVNSDEKQEQTTLPGEAVDEDIVQSLGAVVLGDRAINSHPVKLDRIISIQSVATTVTNDEELAPSDVE